MTPHWCCFVLLSTLAWASCGSTDPAVQGTYSGGALETTYDIEGALTPSAPAADANEREWHASWGPTGGVSAEDITPTYNDSYSFPLSEEGADTFAVTVEGVEQPAHPVRVEETLKESQRVPTAYPLRGIKTLMAGSILFALVLLAFTACEDEALDADGFDTLGAYIGEEVMQLFLDLDDHLDEILPRSPFPVSTFWLVAGAAPAIMLSGLADLVGSLRRRKLGRSPNAKPPLRGAFMALLALVVGLPLFALPGKLHGYDEARDALVEIAGNAALGIALTGIMLLLTSLVRR